MLLSDLRADIAAQRAVVVVGTGVTRSVTGEATATWPGLLNSGLARASALGLIDSASEGKARTLMSGTPTGTDLLHVASVVVDALGGSAKGEFASWIREDVGYLSRGAKHSVLADAIGKIGVPLLTTNYDDVLEAGTGRGYVTWRDLGEMQRVIAGESSDVVHLHGHWKYPETIVLTNGQYAEMLADTSLSALRTSLATVKSMIFVGFGEGLTDPNFKRLREWITDTLPFQQSRHYRLCRETELVSLQDEHRVEPIWPLSYGAAYDDLLPFIQSLAPKKHSGSFHVPSVSAFGLIEEQVRETAVLSTHIRGVDEARISDLLVPPVLLPVPGAQLVASEPSQQPSIKVERCDLSIEIQSTHLILAGEEHSGVSSGLLWLCAEMYLSDPTLTPLVVDYLKLSSGPTPLRKQVVKQLRHVGHSLREDDALPPLLLVLDNVNTVNALRLARVAKELEESCYARVLVGCRTGSETLISAAFSETDLSFAVRFLGRLGRADLRELANLVDPSRSKQLTHQAALLVQQHDLSSTPFTLSMIISAILRGESLLAASSPTSLLDAYVELLLGRGSAVDDHRLGLDSVNKAHILARLAEVFVRRKVGAQSEADVIRELTDILDGYGWPGEASDLLRDLRDRRILIVREREVSFTQNSYLYLFAAKRADVSREFLELLTDNPLYFAPIIAHYAALKRSDFHLVQRLVPDLLKPFLELDVPRARLFLPESAEAELPDLSDEQIDDRIQREIEITPSDDDDEDDDLTPLGNSYGEPDVPFPLQPVDSEPTIPAAIVTLGLASNLLRDTEMVEDQASRTAIFVNILRAHAMLVNMVAADDHYNRYVHDAVGDFARQVGVPPKHVTRFSDNLITILPAAIAFGSITGTLSTGKLARVIDTCLDDPEFTQDIALVLFAHQILFDVHGTGWSRALKVLGTRHKSALAVRTIVRRMAFFSYIRRPQIAEDSSVLLDFLVDQNLLSNNASAAEVARRRGAVIESLKKAKLLAAAKGEVQEFASLTSPLADQEDE